MNVFKHFLAGVMNVTLRETFIVIKEPVAVSPTLLNYVKFLEALKYEDGMYHNYFGEIKKLVVSFVTFWTDTMDEALKEGDRLINTPMNKDTLVVFIQNSIDIRNDILKAFEDEFLPIESTEQQLIYEDILKKYDVYIDSLYKMKATVEGFDKQEHVDAFVKSEFPKSVNNKNEIFRYAHTYISMLLADHLPQIEGSLKDILQRLRKNISNLQEETDKELYLLLHQLYEKNKEQLAFNRRSHAHSAEAAEISLTIEKMRQRVTEHGRQKPMARLAEEEQFFDARQKELSQIATTLRKVKNELESVQREQAIYQSMISTELPGTKLDTYITMSQRYEKRSEVVKKNLIDAAKALLTFFCVRGPNVAMRVDNVGPYHVDELGHQVYHFVSELKQYHVDCEKNFKEIGDEKRYYFDDAGRYWYDKGEKVYQVQDCASSYKLGEDTLLKKITVDCGHSEMPNKDCGMQVKEPVVTMMLPKTDPVDITSTLAPEAARYLWGAVGGVLPRALRDVAELRPRNPVHYLAHRLLAHKYGNTKAELQRNKEEADAFRDDILRERKEQAAAAARAWQAKQVPRRKPTGSDGETAAYEYKATRDLIRSIHFYD